jgi:hypothetical protein
LKTRNQINKQQKWHGLPFLFTMDAANIYKFLVLSKTGFILKKLKYFF